MSTAVEDILEIVKIALTNARKGLKEKRDEQKNIKPKDVQGEIVLGGRLKGLQQAIDIVKQIQGGE